MPRRTFCLRDYMVKSGRLGAGHDQGDSPSHYPIQEPDHLPKLVKLRFGQKSFADVVSGCSSSPSSPRRSPPSPLDTPEDGWTIVSRRRNANRLAAGGDDKKKPGLFARAVKSVARVFGSKKKEEEPAPPLRRSTRARQAPDRYGSTEVVRGATRPGPTTRPIRILPIVPGPGNDAPPSPPARARRTPVQPAAVRRIRVMTSSTTATTASPPPSPAVSPRDRKRKVYFKDVSSDASSDSDRDESALRRSTRIRTAPVRMLPVLPSARPTRTFQLNGSTLQDAHRAALDLHEELEEEEKQKKGVVPRQQTVAATLRDMFSSGSTATASAADQSGVSLDVDPGAPVSMGTEAQAPPHPTGTSPSLATVAVDLEPGAPVSTGTEAQAPPYATGRSSSSLATTQDEVSLLSDEPLGDGQVHETLDSLQNSDGSPADDDVSEVLSSSRSMQEDEEHEEDREMEERASEEQGSKSPTVSEQSFVIGSHWTEESSPSDSPPGEDSDSPPESEGEWVKWNNRRTRPAFKKELSEKTSTIHASVALASSPEPDGDTQGPDWTTIFSRARGGYTTPKIPVRESSDESNGEDGSATPEEDEESSENWSDNGDEPAPLRSRSLSTIEEVTEPASDEMEDARMAELPEDDDWSDGVGDGDGPHETLLDTDEAMEDSREEEPATQPMEVSDSSTSPRRKRSSSTSSASSPAKRARSDSSTTPPPSSSPSSSLSTPPPSSSPSSSSSTSVSRSSSSTSVSSASSSSLRAPPPRPVRRSRYDPISPGRPRPPTRSTPGPALPPRPPLVVPPVPPQGFRTRADALLYLLNLHGHAADVSYRIMQRANGADWMETSHQIDFVNHLSRVSATARRLRWDGHISDGELCQRTAKLAKLVTRRAQEWR